MFERIFRIFKGTENPRSDPPQLSSLCQPPIREHVSARQLLKDATQLKKQGAYKEACEALRHAYALNSGDITLEDRLRLPAYLQLAGRNDEAWCEFNELKIHGSSGKRLGMERG